MLSLRGKGLQGKEGTGFKDTGFEGMRFNNKKVDKDFEGNGDRKGKKGGQGGHKVSSWIGQGTLSLRGSARGQCVLVGSGAFSKDIVAMHQSRR